MTDQPLGTPTPEHDHAPLISEPSIVDTILNLDEFLSSDVRRAEKTARFCTRPDLEAHLDELEAQLAQLVDAQGNLPRDAESAIADTDATRARELIEEIQQTRAEMASAFRSVRMRQISDDDWAEFTEKWRKELNSDDPMPVEYWNQLIVTSAAAPAISAEQVVVLRQRLGRPAMDELGSKAFYVNTQSGVSVPKSPLSSHVLKQLGLARS